MFFCDPHFDLWVCAHVFHPIGFVPAARKQVDRVPERAKPDLDLVRLACDAAGGGDVAVIFVRELGEVFGVHGGEIINQGYAKILNHRQGVCNFLR